MDSNTAIGQTLDGKYQIERELGRGGMGTVYLATHLGTERPVAVKIVAPQYMERPEFVERFRREARAAGRLRHPNVVDVTDFGFAETDHGRVAYLVMEYLDGCTLGEILEEEKNLPVGWTIDIIEQVCSAVQEAHEQGIIHRDLKPDNIWLEPNQRGGYTVKVLDFGIAKLDVFHGGGNGETVPAYQAAAPTFGDLSVAGTIHDSIAPTLVADLPTIADSETAGISVAAKAPVGSEDRTVLLAPHDAVGADQDSVGTRLIRTADNTDRSQPGDRDTGDPIELATRDLTRVGAVLGTPLYMSPEQCSGYRLDARSDVYSIGVIAYQMLSGETPFKGEFSKVMKAHKVTPAPQLRSKKVRRKLKKVIASALAKDPDERPQTAEAFASALRSRSEGIFGLLRRAFVIYSEKLPKFLLLTTFFSLPMVVLTLILLAFSFLKVSEMIPETVANVGMTIDGFALSIASAFCTNLIVGSIAWIVAQHLAVPLRPIRLRPALLEARRKWKRIAGAGFLTAIFPFVLSSVGAIIGFIIAGLLMLLTYPVTGSFAPVFVGGLVGAACLGVAGFLGAYISFILVPPVVMLENLRVFASLRRSWELVRRSLLTSAGAVFIMFLIPSIIAIAIAYVVNVSAKAFELTPRNDQQTQTNSAATGENAEESNDEKSRGFNWSLSGSKLVKRTEGMDMQTRVKVTALESLIQIIWLPMQILVFSFSAIIVALLYLKTRMAGGESMSDLLARFEEADQPRKKWQERVRQRLIQSGRLTVTSKP